MCHISYDTWRTTPPDQGNGTADPIALFWRNFRFAVRHGAAESYLAIYRDVPVFAEVVQQAERQIARDAA